MDQLLDLLKTMPEYNLALNTLLNGHHAAITGIGQINRSHILAGLYSHTDRPIVIICQDDATAKRTCDELKDFLGFECTNLSSRELTLYDTTVASREWEHKRLRQFYNLSNGNTRLQIMSWNALSQRTIPPVALKKASFSLKTGQEYHLDDLIDRLSCAGYSRCAMVEGPGQYAVRGGIVDIYSPAESFPVRAEFFGDELDTMGYFDPDTQRRTENISSVAILPVAETLPRMHADGIAGLCSEISVLISRQRKRKNPHESLISTLQKDLEKFENGVHNPSVDRYMSLIYPEFATAISYIPQNAIVVLCDQGDLQRSCRTRITDMGMQLDSMLQGGLVAGELCDYVLDWDDFCKTVESHSILYLDRFTASAYPDNCKPSQLLPMSAKQLPGYGGNLDTAASDLLHYQKIGFSSLVLCGSRRRAELLREMLDSRGLKSHLCIPLTTMPQPGHILLTDGTLPYGMEYPDGRIAILTEGQLTGKAEPRRKTSKKSSTNRQKLNSFTDLTPGDLVVHENYGIGRFVAMEQMKIDGAIKDYIKIAYQGTDTLFVPATQLDLVSKYIGGGEDANIRLNKIGTDAWHKTKAKARKAAKDMAGELIQLYAARRRQEGFAFSADSPWQQEFEDNFHYPETDDQLRCISEIKHDMESPIPMDRLLCGDVGFGKTEVALRSVIKAVMDGKQAAILVPTTVLAQQHYQTAIAR
ncbi:MAG: DEAD/DEAH box helicase, partial [Oscillospiraceae bacterium]|nr:DEAD/DEAH box helicase [Oscillospiraceae bacterium]